MGRGAAVNLKKFSRYARFTSDLSCGYGPCILCISTVITFNAIQLSVEIASILVAFCDMTMRGERKFSVSLRGACLKMLENHWLRAFPQDHALRGDCLSVQLVMYLASPNIDSLVVEERFQVSCTAHSSK